MRSLTLEIKVKKKRMEGEGVYVEPAIASRRDKAVSFIL